MEAVPILLVAVHGEKKMGVMHWCGSSLKKQYKLCIRSVLLEPGASIPMEHWGTCPPPPNIYEGGDVHADVAPQYFRIFICCG